MDIKFLKIKAQYFIDDYSCVAIITVDNEVWLPLGEDKRYMSESEFKEMASAKELPYADYKIREFEKLFEDLKKANESPA